MTLDADRLHALVAEELGAVHTQQLSPTLLKVSVPNPRHLHDTVAIVVEELGQDQFRISDAGAIHHMFGADSARLVEIMHCAGAPVQVRDGAVSYLVQGSTDLEHTLLHFAQAIISAPLVWNALQCADEDVDDAEPRRRTAVSRMARDCRTHIVGAVPRARQMLRYDLKLRERDDQATAPLALTLTPTGAPRLLAGFIPSGAKAQPDAKARVGWLWNVAQDLTVPKYVVVADPHQVQHMAEMYDRWNVTAIPEADYSLLVADVEREVQRSFGQ